MSVFTQLLSIIPVSPVRGRTRRLAAIATTALALLGGAGTADAQTEGFQLPVTGGAVLARLGFVASQQPSSFGEMPTFIDYDPTAYNYIGNPYMAVVIGVAGTRTVSFDEGQFVATSIPHNIPGMLSFGNLGGSLRLLNDDKRSLNGFGTSDFYGTSGFALFGTTGGGVPAGYGVWPLPAWWQAGGTYDYSAYVSTNVDGIVSGGNVTGGETTQIVGNDENWVIEPTFRSAAGDNFLLSEAVIGGNCILHQEVRLFRNTAQMRWTVRNPDVVGHTVYLKFAVNHRSATAVRFDTTNFSSSVREEAYFYTDPNQGPTLRSQVYGVNPDGGPVREVPAQVDVLGERYQRDLEVTDPFHSRHILDGFGATRPSTVFVGDSEDLFPIFDGDTGFSPGRGTSAPPVGGENNLRRYEKIEDGVAVAVYYGPITVAPGATSAPIVTYYGNGNSTDRLDADFTTATEAEESFQYNSNAATTLTPQQIDNPTLDDTARQFLTPQVLDIYGSVYNRQLSEAQFNIVLRDVRMSVTLPEALRFARNPSTGQTDVATKTVGDIPGDRDSIARWVAEPTGRLFGTYFYQMTATVAGIAPLSRTVNRAISIPATPLFNVGANYQMIGFPFEFDRVATNNFDTGAIFNTLSKPADISTASLTLFKWVPDPESVGGEGRYAVTRTIERGQGYFYRPDTARLLFLNGARPDPQGTPAEPEQRVQYFEKVLERGWNMITNPWVYGIPVSFISLAEINNENPEADLNLTYFPDAVASGLVRGGIFFYNTEKRDYDFFQDYNQELRPYQGYWVYLEDRKIMRFAVPSQKQSAVLPDAEGNIPVTRPITRKKEAVGAIASRRAFPTNQTASNWKMQLVAKRIGANASDTANDGMTLLGVSPNAKDGDDSRDLPKPPPVMNDYVSVRVIHEVKNGKSRAFAQDLKAPGGKKEWEIEVLSDRDGPVSLSWPNLGRLPKTVRLTLTDKATGRKVAMRGSSSLVVNVAANVKSRFVVTADKQATRPLAITNVRLRDAGSRGPNGGSNYLIEFKTTADSQVEARITTITGKPVSVLATGRAATADGITRLQWNGRSQKGDQLPAGPYMVELKARDENGETVSRKMPITTLR